MRPFILLGGLTTTTQHPEKKSQITSTRKEMTLGELKKSKKNHAAIYPSPSFLTWLFVGSCFKMSKRGSAWGEELSIPDLRLLLG